MLTIPDEIFKLTQITTPDFPESVHEASVGTWFKQAGDSVVVGEAILELHTDKAVQEINAIQDGTITAVLKQVDDVVRPGDPLCEFDPATVGEATTVAAADPSKNASDSPEPTQPQREQESPSDESDEDANQDFSDLIEIEVAQPIPMSNSSGDDQTTQVAGLVELGPDETTATEESPSEVEEAGEESQSYSGNLTEIHETESEPLPSSSDEVAPPGLTSNTERERDHASDGRAKRVKLTRRQLTAARRMVEVKQNTVMTTTFNEVDMSQIIDMRSRHGNRFLEQHGVKLGFMSFFIKAVCAALKSYPVLNSEIQDEELLLKEYYDIGIAVASEHGLAVPVIRGADDMTFAEIELMIREFADKARTGSWDLADLAGGTFTITNGGVFGSMLSTPILNPPQVGILGMHNIVERPVAVDGQVAVRPMMYVALTYDHRIVEGAQAVQFLRQVKDSLEAADVLLLGT